jgi:hypothetical protein
MNDWSDEETDDPLYADRRNFYKVEKWSRDGLRFWRAAVTMRHGLLKPHDKGQVQGQTTTRNTAPGIHPQFVLSTPQCSAVNLMLACCDRMMATVAA